MCRRQLLHLRWFCDIGLPSRPACCIQSGSIEKYINYLVRSPSAAPTSQRRLRGVQSNHTTSTRLVIDNETFRLTPIYFDSLRAFSKACQENRTLVPSGSAALNSGTRRRNRGLDHRSSRIHVYSHTVAHPAQGDLSDAHQTTYSAEKDLVECLVTSNRPLGRTQTMRVLISLAYSTTGTASSLRLGASISGYTSIEASS
jgi:hypothetical protein